MKRQLQGLIKMARSIGGDPLLVQAGGGSVSVRVRGGKAMIAKARGVPMKDITESRGGVITPVKPVAVACQRGRTVRSFSENTAFGHGSPRSTQCAQLVRAPR